MFGDTPLVLVDTPSLLADAVARLRLAPVIGIDTESDGFHRYREKVCLIQISDMDQDYIFDCLALDDLNPLGALFGDPNQIKIFHGADYDVVSMRRDFGFDFVNLFDTMIAAQFLGLPRVGLADLIDRWFAVRVDKTLQRHDWSARPLLPAHLDYARGDTHWLLALREVLLTRLKRAGRLGAVAEECTLVAQRSWQGRQRDPADFLRLKGSRGLDDAALRVLRAVHGYRDREAEAMDRPAFKVIPDHMLLELAERRPETREETLGVLRRGSPLARRHGEGLHAAVVEGVADTRPIPEPKAEARVHLPVRVSGRVSDLLLNGLKEWRSERIERDREPPVTVISNHIIKALSRLAPRSLEELAAVPDMRSWQVERHGVQLLALIEQVAGSGPTEASTGKKRRRRRRGPREDDVGGPVEGEPGAGEPEESESGGDELADSELADSELADSELADTEMDDASPAASEPAGDDTGA